MELNTTAHRLNDFLEEIEELDCHELILLGVSWKDGEKTTPEKLVVHRSSPTSNSTVIPLSMALGMAVREMKQSNLIEVHVPTGKVIIINDESIAFETLEGEVVDDAE